MADTVRILHMIGSFECGGSQAMILNLYKAIDRNRIQFDFIVDHPNLMDLAPAFKSLGAIVYEMPTFKGTNIAEVKAAWNKFFEQHPEYKILHTHVRSYASLYLPIAKKHGLITIAHSHNTSNGKGLSSVLKYLLQFPIRKQADYLFACSEMAGEWLYGKKAVKGDNYKVINNAIESKHFVYNETVRNAVRSELVVQDCFVIGNVGRLVKQKNQAFLLRVFRDILSQKKDARLLILGDGELRDELVRLSQEWKISDAVIFLGSKTNVQDYYQAMDVFVFPSLWEGLGIVAVEAQAAGLPCVVSDQVPGEADIGAGLIQYLPLTDSTSDWCSAILNAGCGDRKDMSQQVIRAGYDIADNAGWLQEFYLEIAQQNRE